PILGRVVRVAVHLDDQRLLGTKEVGDEPTDHGLAAELVTAELTVGKVAPEPLFGFGGVAAHLGGTLMKKPELLDRQAPPLPPPLKGRGFWAPALVVAPPLQGRGLGEACSHPTLPSRLIPSSFCASTANSIGSC